MLKELNILGIRKKTIVARFDKAQIAVMEAIDEKTEKNIEKLHPWFNGKEDCKIIKRILPMSSDIAGNQMRSGFNYESGIVNSVDGEFRWHPAVDPIKWFKYNHCLLGKPKRVIVYKTTLSML